MIALHPTTDPELNAVLQEFVTSLKAILGTNLLAVYLQGSFGVGDWDVYSDVDFLVAIDHEVDGKEVAALQAMHARIYDLDSEWAKHLEGSYFPKAILLHADPAGTPLLYLDNTSRGVILSDHDNTRVVRWVTRECGIPLVGPPADQLIALVSADDLREEVRVTIHDWARELLADPNGMDNGWRQPYVVLSYCRMLQTLETGRIHSKLAGARWAMQMLDHKWSDLIERAWEARPFPIVKVRQKANPEDLARTFGFIRYALEVSES